LDWLFTPILDNFQLVSEPYFPEKSLTVWRGDVRTGEIEEVPPKFDEEDNSIIIEEGSKTGASNAPTLEELTRRLEELTLKSKTRRQKEALPQVKNQTPHLKRMSPKRKRKEEEIMIDLSITQCLLITIIFLALPLILSYLLTKLPILMELVITNGSIA
jgi:hypothetical protein